MTTFRARQIPPTRPGDQSMGDGSASVGAGTHEIRWVPKKLGWRSADWLYTVSPTYTIDGEKWRAVFHAQAHNVRALGEIRDTPALAKLDAQDFADNLAANS